MAPIRILHVDDEREFCDLTAEFLEREDDRFEVVSETDPDRALNRFSGRWDEIDCILSDYQMPGTNGIEFLRTLRRRNPDLLPPFILLTGKGSEDVAAEALNAGASSYIKKGTSDVFEYVAERINHDLRAAKAEQYRRRFDGIARALDDPVYVLDDKGRFTYVNEAFVDLVGYDRDTVLGSSPPLVKAPDSVAKAEHELGRLLSDTGPESVTFEIDIETSEGETVPCEDHMGVLPYEGDQFIGSLGVIRDISTRKEREQKLTEAKERYQLLVEQNLVGLYIVRDGDILYHNEPFGELFDYAPEPNALVGKSLSSLVQFADSDRLEENLYKAQSRQVESLRQPFVGRTRGGDTVNIEAFARGIELDGDPAVLGTVVDVGKDEEQYWKLRRERDRLEEFTSIVSHDLRSPLNVASGHLELAMEADGFDSDLSESLSKADDALTRMDDLLDDLLALAKQGEVVDEGERIGLRTVAESSWETVATEGASLDVTATGIIHADPRRIKSVFENLYRNAVEHGWDDVTIEVGELDDGFYVADDGSGVAEEDRERVFESGYTTRDDGTGFGLSIVSEVVEAHGWRIELTESRDGGARFEIRANERPVRPELHETR